jgi:hypothetical protein
MSGESTAALTELLDRLNSHARGYESRAPLTPAQARAMYLVASDVVDEQLGAEGHEVPEEVLAGTVRMLAAAVPRMTE